MHDDPRGMDMVAYHEVISNYHDELQRTSEGNPVPISVVRDSCLMYVTVVYDGQIRYVGISSSKVLQIDTIEETLLYDEEVDASLEKVVVIDN